MMKIAMVLIWKTREMCFSLMYFLPYCYQNHERELRKNIRYRWRSACDGYMPNEDHIERIWKEWFKVQ